MTEAKRSIVVRATIKVDVETEYEVDGSIVAPLTPASKVGAKREARVTLNTIMSDFGDIALERGFEVLEEGYEITDVEVLYGQ